MRVSPVGVAFDSLEEVLAEAKRSAEVTHNNHPEGIAGAQAVAGAILEDRRNSFSAATAERAFILRFYHAPSSSMINRGEKGCQAAQPRRGIFRDSSMMMSLPAATKRNIEAKKVGILPKRLRILSLSFFIHTSENPPDWPLRL